MRCLDRECGKQFQYEKGAGKAPAPCPCPRRGGPHSPAPTASARVLGWTSQPCTTIGPEIPRNQHAGRKLIAS